MTLSRTLFVAISVCGLVLTGPLHAETLKTTEAASSIEAVGAKITGDHTLKFERFDGTATVGGEKVTSLSFTVEMARFTTEMGDSKWGKKLVAHLKSPDFFDVAKHPKASFVSTIIEEQASKWGTHRVTGNLTLGAKTVLVRFPATIVVAKASVTGKTEFTINRNDFGIVYKGKPDDLIRDDVLLKIDLNFSR